MAESFNKQPVFTSTPFLYCDTIDPWYNTSSLSPVGSDFYVFSEPTLIERITISATGNTSGGSAVSAVSAKLVYVFLYSGNSGTYSLYKTLAMPATTVDDTTPNPELEISMDGGILFNSNDAILIASSVNFSTSSQYGDYLAITLEGGTYAVV
jgi:hypothetical protein